MSQHDIIKMPIESTREWIETLLEEITDEESFQRGRDNLNHIVWQIGHICVSTKTLADMVGTSINFPDEDRYRKLFDYESTLLESPSDYPKLAEVRKWWDKFHVAALNAIESMSDKDMEKEVQITEKWTERVDKFIVFMGLHQTYHTGQIAQIRSKVIGRKGAFG